MGHEEIKCYFETNPPSEVVQWNLWAKISDTQLFLSSCYTGIRNYNGPLEMCPAWWHLKDFYQHVRRNGAETTYLSKMLWHFKGKGFVEYINDLKISYIMDLLRQDKMARNYTNAALAEEAGFSSTQHFVHAFKARTGVPTNFFIEQIKNK